MHCSPRPAINRRNIFKKVKIFDVIIHFSLKNFRHDSISIPFTTFLTLLTRMHINKCRESSQEQNKMEKKKIVMIILPANSLNCNFHSVYYCLILTLMQPMKKTMRKMIDMDAVSPTDWSLLSIHQFPYHNPLIFAYCTNEFLRK